MRRKRQAAHASHDRWLVSYADFITLLFAFFVVLYATSQADKKKQSELAASMQAAFHPTAGLDSHPAAVASMSAAKRAQSAADRATTSAAEVKTAAAEAKTDAGIRQHLQAAAGREIANGTIALHEAPDGLVISLKEAGFFDSGTAEVRATAVPVLQRIAAALPEAGLRVEGHTDDVPIHTPQFQSNWELSGARASSIARLLLHDPHVLPERMSVAGYAEFHPVASNASAEGRAKNPGSISWCSTGSRRRPRNRKIPP
jgi:chemotaxis protein MotB